MTAAEYVSEDRERSEHAALWAVRLSEGTLPPYLEDEFAAWIEADSRNGELLDEIMGGWLAVERYAAAPQIVAIREAALSSARRSARRREPRRWSGQLTAGLAAAVVLLAAGVMWAGLWLTPDTYHTGVGERRVVVLEDGSKISLDGATQVRVSYRGGERRLWLDNGRAKFDVAKDTSRPFTVAAGEREVLATGTSFSVELIQKEVRVVLYEGSVRLLEKGAALEQPLSRTGVMERSEAIWLEPGYEIVLPEQPLSIAAAPPPPVPVENPQRSLLWEYGQLVVEDESVAMVAERMNRYADMPLQIGDDAAARLRISGVFRAGDTEALVQGLEAFGVVARRNGDSVTLFLP
jgi:transmembrane sensor